MPARKWPVFTAYQAETRDVVEPGYEYCLVRRNYNTRTDEVWFTAFQGQKIVGKSRTASPRPTFFGHMRRFDRDAEAAHEAFLQSLIEGGWEPAGTDPKGRVTRLRKRAASP